MDPVLRRRARRRRVVLAAFAAALAMLVAVGAGYAWYQATDSNLHSAMSADPGIGKVLAPVGQGSPYFMVIAGVNSKAVDALLIARVDPARRLITTMSIPRDTQVSIPGHGVGLIGTTMRLGGPRLMIESVRDLTGLQVSHYAVVDLTGFEDIVDSVGGVDVMVPYRIDDPQAAGGNRAAALIRRGLQHLDGQHALVFVRARHQFADQDLTRVADQQLLLKALTKRVVSSGPLSLLGMIRGASTHVQTDLSISDLMGLASGFAGMSDTSFVSVTMPGRTRYLGGSLGIVPDLTGLSAMTSQMQKNQAVTQVPSPDTATLGAPAPSPRSITLSVRNGVGVSGMAKTVGAALARQGFVIKDTTNMDQFVFPETLIVYRSSAEIAKAQVVSDEFPGAMVVPANGMYTFPGDALVIIGGNFDISRFEAKATNRN
jgi:LCP family protein required for cell wall assembly